ncbi:amino acid adenylation domain-containing protein [Spirosoma soli]|uniref:Amino acid adenylation domain-containing protein n=1 Tax=Spirosoma soli TaxID=1770529 RepID=A0ABW5M481_9BACT
MVTSSTHVNFIAVDFDPFAGPDLVRLAPSTEPQTEIWTACQFGGDDANRAYNESVSLRFNGPVDKLALELALSGLVHRHEALRSAFSADGKHICVFQEMPVGLDYRDYSDKADAEKEQIVAEYVKQDALHVFDLVNGPLLKAGLIKLSDTIHHFTFTAHHLVCDGWSLGVMLQDISVLYSAYVQHKTPDLPAVLPFSQYAIDEQTFVGSREYEQIEQFWLDQYRQSVPVLEMPIDTSRPRIRTYAGNRLDFPLDDELVLAVRQMGIKAGCSFVTTLMAAFEVLLHRLTGQNDIVLGLPAAGQSATDNPGLVGHCVNLLPLRSYPSPEQRFVDFLKQRKIGLLDALEHQRLTFGRLLKKLPITRDVSRMPLVPVVFNVDIGLDNGVSFHGLQYQLISNPRAFENFELSLNASGSEKKMTLEWSYNAHLFKAKTIQGIHQKFERLLWSVVEAPEQLLGDIPLVEKPRLSPQIAPWNDTQADFPSHKSLHDLFTETARAFPDNIAVRFGKATLTYQALNEKANQLARLLVAKGVQPGDRIGLAAERSLELMVSLLAVMKTGAAYIPVDPQHPAERIEFILADASCQILLTSANFKNRISLALEEIVLEEIWPSLDQYATADLNVPTSGDDLIYVLYTSGTTGKPKGVQTKHNGVVNVLLSVQKRPGLLPADKTVTLATISFDLATVEIYLPLLTGAELVFVDNTVSRNGQALADLLRTEGISFLQTTPATLRMLWEAGWRGDKQLTVISCAEALPMDLAHKLMASCKSLWNFYGPTETTIYATGTQILPTDELITIGKPIDNTQVFIVDEQLQSLAEGQAGEICIAGVGLARGYLNQPGLTAEKFIDFVTPDGRQVKLYRSGDLGQFESGGNIRYLGRIDQQVKIRGHRIEVAEIEHNLLKQAGVKNAVVIAREDTPGDQRLVAYLVPDRYISDEEEQIKTWRTGIRRMLPEYMIPNNFVLLAELPVTANGKTDKKALPKPGSRAVAVEARSTQPQTKEEIQLASIWMDVFGLSTISIDDNFFDIGGHSLIAVQVMNRLEQQTGRRLPLSALFEYPTIRKLAALIQPDKPVKSWKSLVPIKPDGSKEPIYIIHGIGLNLLNFSSLATYMDAEQPIYGLQARGLDGTEEPLDKMESIAACYIEEVLEQNPTGPYAIAGYSFGGYVAYEMARQLTAMGKEIKMLAMFDTDARALAMHHSGLNRVMWKIGRQFPKLVWIGRSLLERPAQTIQYQRDYFKRKAVKLLQMVGLGQEPKPQAEMAHLNYIMDKHETAFQNYVLHPYDGTLDLFRATTRLYFVDDYHYLGWKEFALRGVRVHDVPGDHETIMHAPNDKALAESLQRALDNSQA